MSPVLVGILVFWLLCSGVCVLGIMCYDHDNPNERPTSPEGYLIVAVLGPIAILLAAILGGRDR